MSTSPTTPLAASDSDGIVVLENLAKLEEEENNRRPNKTYQSPDADFTLISADGLPFKVHKYVLVAASDTFRSMLSTCASPPSPGKAKDETNPVETPINELKLTDGTLELQHTIRLFLDFIYGKEIKCATGSWRKYINVGFLFKKYECTGASQSYKWALRYWALDSTSSTRTLFLAASHLDEVETLAQIIANKTGTWGQAGQPSKWNDEDDGEGEGGGNPIQNKTLRTAVAGNYVMDLTSAHSSFFSAIPPVYSFALMRASRTKGTNGVYDKKNRNAIASEFERIIKGFDGRVATRFDPDLGHQRAQRNNPRFFSFSLSFSLHHNERPIQYHTRKTPQPNDAYQSQDADLVLISSDGVRFKVHKFVLIGASTVFRSIFTTATVHSDAIDEIQLSDHNIERQWSIGLFLDLLYGREIAPPGSAFRKYLNVKRLLEKYDCPSGQRSWRWAIQSWGQVKGSFEIAVCALAGEYEDCTTCHSVLLRAEQWWTSRGWAHGNRHGDFQELCFKDETFTDDAQIGQVYEGRMSQPKVHAGVLDLRYVPAFLLPYLHPAFTTSLLQSIVTAQGQPALDSEVKEIARQFKRRML